MKWLARLFHEPRDPEIETIKRQLRTEKERHTRELDDIHDALTDLGAAYELAERERRGVSDA